MVPVDCGAVEAHFLRLASSTDLQLNPDLVVLDLSSSPCVHPRKMSRSSFKAASGPGCIPWNSSLRPSLFLGLPLCKVVRKPKQVAPCIESPRRRFNFAPSLHQLSHWSHEFRTLPVSQRNQIARAFLSTSRALTVSQKFFTQTMCPFVPGWLHRPIENGASQYCWWFSHADVAHQHPFSAMQEAMSYGVPLHVFDPVTSTDDVCLLVSALHRWYPTGLLILHRPAMCCLLFLPSCPVQQLSFGQASHWLHSFPRTRAMLFTRPANALIGHFTACRLEASGSIGNFLPYHASRPWTSGVDEAPLESQPSFFRCLGSASASGSFAGAGVDSSASSHVVGASPVGQKANASNSSALPFFPKWLPKTSPPVDSSTCSHAVAASPLGQNGNGSNSSALPFFPKWLAKTSPPSLPATRVNLATLSSSSPAVRQQQCLDPEEVDSALSLLPWQSFKTSLPSPSQAPKNSCPETIPFTVDVSAPATWLDALRPSLPPSPSLSPASFTLSPTSLCPNPCEVCRSFHLMPDCVCIRQSSSVAGCSCVGVSGVCMCGFVDSLQVSVPNHAMPRTDGAGAHCRQTLSRIRSAATCQRLVLLLAARRLRYACLPRRIGICWQLVFRLQSPEKRRAAMWMILMLPWIGLVRQIDDARGSVFRLC